MGSLVSSIPRRVRQRIARELRAQRLIWLAPVAVVWVMMRQPIHLVQRADGVLVAAAIILLIASRPAGSLLIFLGVLPFHTFLFALLFRMGVPLAAVRPLAFWKELIILGLVLAAARKAAREGHKPDRLDAVAVLYLLITGLYLFVPSLFLHGLTWPRFYVRFTDWRSLDLYVVLLLAIRHLRLHKTMFDAAARVVMASGGVVAAIGIFEFFRSSSWNSFVVNTVHLPRYQAIVLRSPVQDPKDLRWWSSTAGHKLVRIGSVMFSPLPVSFYLVVVFAVGLERITRRKAGSWTYLATGASVLALLFTQTRSALIAGILVLALALRPAPGRPPSTRARLALLLTAAIIVIAPIAASSGATNRFVNGDTLSNQGHTNGFHIGVSTMAKHPLGLGLGTSPDTGDRFGVKNTVFSEDYYLQVGDTVGVFSLVLFALLILALVLEVQRAALPGPDGALSASVVGAVAGLAVSAFFLHAWASQGMAWTLWSLAGLVLGVRGGVLNEVTAPPSMAQLSSTRG